MKEESIIKLTTPCVKQSECLGRYIDFSGMYPKKPIDFNSIIASKIEDYEEYKVTIIIETIDD
jgi:hypothetical protein